MAEPFSLHCNSLNRPLSEHDVENPYPEKYNLTFNISKHQSFAVRRYRHPIVA
jgi:hypothetical protein